eukprot:Blabericola_migrator_1__5204@NODE_267_length_10594_cov_56_602451_g223_i0_p8_GENE_NODE_267_length_10594_cov_56_602451_g223_i0NODE_267_length_10594_cov_56_602451_g223_i0_p8_ORF_typecomplete_len140_score17_59Robl_LC7/PF03259_17/9_8e17LAMTOR5/PF16672_5/0_00082_NODE_267_length_10594_cov_56_602451_g223_i01013810557
MCVHRCVLVKRRIRSTFYTRIGQPSKPSQRPLIFSPLKMMKDALDRLNRLRKQPGVTGVVVATKTGKAIHTSLPPNDTQVLTSATAQCLTQVVAAMEKLDPEDDVTFLRVKTKKKSYMLSREDEYVLLVVTDDQPNPTA